MEYLQAAIGHCVNDGRWSENGDTTRSCSADKAAGRRSFAHGIVAHGKGRHAKDDMTPKWRKLDLGGEGLQAINLRLARTLRRRSTAWALLALFPLGAHRWYLHETGWAASYLLLTLAAAAGWLGGWPWLLLSLPLLLLLLVIDIAGLDNRIAAFNKRQRTAAYLSPGTGAPADFRGRIPTEAGGQAPARVPGFAEQEKLLRALAEKSAGPGGGKPHPPPINPQ
jgi:TM2 domain-containing membrane protein YozV